MSKFVIIGGGIAGLSAAYYLQKKKPANLSITLIEAASYWGGKIVSERVAEVVSNQKFIVEGGPDTFVATKPWGTRLCQELNITDRLVGTSPDTRKTYILKNNQLIELPDGLTMMIPTEFGAMLRTRLLSLPAKMRMGLDFFLPAARENGDETMDETMAEFVSRRLGRSAYENLIEPLMSGIYAGDGDKLSLQATLPYLRDLELKYGGLVKGALAVRSQHARKSRSSAENLPLQPTGDAQKSNGSGSSRSIFLTPMTGLSEIVERLLEYLRNAGVDLRLNTAVTDILKDANGYTINLSNKNTIHADGLILATPAYMSADLIDSFASDLSAELNAIEYSSTATVSLAYREQDLKRPLDGYGYVIPRRAGRLALACTWSSTKFPHRAPAGYALLRVFIGRAGQETEILWDEQELLSIALDELKQTLSIHAQPIFKRVYYWEKAMPQYNRGHLDRLQRIDAGLMNYPGLALAGNGYRGIGIPDCIHSGEVAAESLLKLQHKHKISLSGGQYEN